MIPTEAAFLLAIRHVAAPERKVAISRYRRFLPDCHRQHKLHHKKLQELTSKYEALETRIQEHIQSQRNTRMEHSLATCRKAKAELIPYKGDN